MKRIDLSQIAYDYLCEQIINSNLEPETAIVENDICQILNMSRTPVREALKRLEAEGLVYKIKDMGTLVKDITYDDIREIFEIRSLIELHVLESYVDEVSAEELDELIHMHETLGTDNSPEEYYRADRAYHNSLMGYCTNSRLIHYWREINNQVEKLRRISAATPKRLPRSREEHLAILYAIRERNRGMAHDRLAYHLDEVKKSVIEAKRNSYKRLK